MLFRSWWTVLIERLVEENHMLRLALAGPSAELTADYARQRMMLVGESVTLTILAVALAGFVVRYARAERTQNRRLEGMLAASTHELKTPIAGVKALLESLKSGVLPPEMMGPFLDKGLVTVDRLEHIVEGILAFQHAVAARAPKLQDQPLELWVDAVLAQRLPGEKLECDLGEAGSVVVRAATDTFRVVLENLLDNARKYGGDTVVHLRAHVQGDRVAIEVTDQGVGFRPEDARMIFEPYERAGKTERRRGTGLGLYIARTLARSIDGDLTARSDGEGMGATFTLLLPRG